MCGVITAVRDGLVAKPLISTDQSQNSSAIYFPVSKKAQQGSYASVHNLKENNNYMSNFHVEH